MLILIRNDGDHIEPLRETQEVLVKVLDRTGRHISAIAVVEDSNTSEVTISVEPPLVPHAKIVLLDGEDETEVPSRADAVARKAHAAAAERGPDEP